MCPDQSPHVQGWHLPAFRWRSGMLLLIGLLIAAYASGCMVGREQEHDQQQARQSACNADTRCLRP